MRRTEATEAPGAAHLVTAPEVTIALETSQRCNLACRYCYLGRGSDPGLSDMQAEVALRALRFFSGLASRLHVRFFGGEPLLNFPTIRDVVERVRRNEKDIPAVTFSVVTNGTLIDEPVAAFLAEHRLGITLSLDGPPDIHDASRTTVQGAGTHHAVQRSIDLLRRAGAGSGIFLRGTWTRRSVPISRVIDHYCELEPRAYRLTPSLVSGRPSFLPDLTPCIIREQTRQMVAAFFERVLAGRFVPSDAEVLDTIGSFSGPVRRYHCAAGRSYFAVGADGKLYPCHRFWNRPDCSIGDVVHGIDDAAARRLTGVPVERREPCRTCWARRFCGGTCYFEALLRTGDPAAVCEDGCAYRRTRIEEVLAWLHRLRDAHPERLAQLIASLAPATASDPRPLQGSVPLQAVFRRAEGVEVVNLDYGALLIREEGPIIYYHASPLVLRLWSLAAVQRTAGALIEAVSAETSSPDPKLALRVGAALCGLEACSFLVRSP